MNQFNLAPGKYVVADCGKTPSEKNCKLLMVAPEGQRDDLLDAGVAHAVRSHGHQETPELREGINKTLEIVEIS